MDLPEEKKGKHYENEAEEIHSLVEELQDSFIGTIRETRTQAGTVMEKSNYVNGEVRQITNHITDISSFMKDMESSIEAARAGEAGKGFAIVAEQIGKLATTTSEEIAKVDTIINAIHESSAALSSVCTDIMEFLTNSVIQDYREFGAMADNYREDANYYADVAQTMGGNAERLYHLIRDINQNIGTISESQKVLNSSIHTSNGTIQDLAKSTVTISQESEVMKESIEAMNNMVMKFNV